MASRGPVPFCHQISVNGVSMFDIEFWAVVIGASATSTIIHFCIQAFRDAGHKRTEADFSALYLALALEAYADGCAKLIGESSTDRASRGDMGKHHPSILPVAGFPETINWKALGIERSAKILSFPIRVDAERARLADHAEYVLDEDEIGFHVERKAARYGLEALALATELRKQNRIEQNNAENVSRVRSYLNEQLA